MNLTFKGPTNAFRSGHRTGFSATANRQRKAEKIRRILLEARGTDILDDSILDIGTGNGEIAAYFGDLSRHVVSVDVSDARVVDQGFEFQQIRGEQLPFPDRSFDVVISNHVIEHLSDQQRHVMEIERVLKDDGLAYLATPNRLWPWEYHYRVALLHYLPPPIFERCLALLGKFTEKLNLVSYRGLRRLLEPHFAISTYSDRVCRRPGHYAMVWPGWLERTMAIVPLAFYTRTVRLHPTFLLVLRKRTPRRGARHSA